MSHAHLKAGTKSKDANHSHRSAETSHYRKPSIHTGQGAIYSAGPVLGISRKEVSIGKPGDKYEKEADAAAEKISSGQPAGTISRMANDEVRSQEIKKPEETSRPIQKQEIKKSEETPKTVQKQEIKKPEETKAVQKQEIEKPEETPKTVQKQEEPEETIQTSKNTGGGTGTSMSNAASHAISNKGSGKSLSSSTQGALESGFGTGFGNVRVHDDSKAHEAADALSARAFTHGSDIWLGKGESQNDMKLMAHEAAHVVQQTGRVQRADGKGGGSGGKINKKNGGAIFNGEQMEIPAISLPKVADKNKVPIPLPIPRKPPEHTDQREIWKKKVNVDNAVDKKLPEQAGIENKQTGKKLFYLKLSEQESFLIGDRTSLKERLRLPNWTKNGIQFPYDVDHIREQQLGGENDISNFQLLDFRTNRSAGSKIKNEINNRISEAIDPHVGLDPDKKWKKKPSPETVRKKFDITFKKLEGDIKLAGEPDNRWKKDDVEKGEHLKALKVLSLAEVKKYKLLQDKNELKIFTNVGAGKPKSVEWDPNPNDNVQKIGEDNWAKVKGFRLDEIKYTPEDPAQSYLKGTVFKKNKAILEKDFQVPLIEDAPYIVRISASSLRAQLGALGAYALSPIEIFDINLDDAVVVKGILRPSLPIFKGLEIDITIDGENITLSKTFTADEINFPRPITVTEASLTLSGGTGGFAVGGDVFFEIERLGKGKVSGLGSISEGFSIEGEFILDPKLIDTGKVKVWYRKDKLGGEGELGIKEGKVRGIKSANIKASYQDDRFEATGTAELSIPGIKTVNMVLSYSEKEGLAIGGSFELKDDIPGIKSGSGQALVKQRPDGKGYDITASGKAVPKIPGISSSIDIAYENGAITIEGTATYQKGMLNGSILIGVTNRRPVSPDGKPAGEPSNKLIVYGGGAVTVKIAPWLQGTVGIKLMPNGEIEVAGTIALPNTLDIFPEKKLDKNIFRINLDIPIVGVAVLGQRIGIFATIGGGLDLIAGIGPGQLRDTAITITYNPAHEENTHVKGGANLFIPAHAGLRLFVRGALGAGIPIVSASAGLEVGGALGIEGAITAGVKMDWTPAKGLVLDAFGRIYAEPKFTFDITGFVMVEANLLVKTVELYNKRWQLKKFEYGSGLRFGVKFPIHYEEGKPFDVSMKDLEFEVPQIDKDQLLKDLIARIA